MKILITISLLLTACAHTDFYRDGKRVARFQGDMTGMTFRLYSDGSIAWAGNINHSAPTLAQGKAASDKINALGAAGAGAVIMSLFK